MTMGDMISRDAVLKILNNSRSIRARCGGVSGIWINLLNVVGEIERVPAAEPVQHGHWIQAGHDGWSSYIRCSKCKRYLRDIHPSDYKFCPYCGAKMDGGNECSVTHRAD